MKKPLVWFLLIIMIGSIFPPGLTKQAFSATAATYFIPDDRTLQNTSLLTTEHGVAGTTQISRNNVLISSSPTLTITGTYSYVTEDSLRAKVEQLSSKTVVGGINWVTDSSKFNDGSIAKDTSTTAQKFKAMNLSLFPGFNKITLSGSQNGITRSDVFYVLFDQVPYVQNIKLMGSSLGDIYLNEGTKVVSDKDSISLQGEVKNVTDVTVAVNSGAPLVSTLTQTGKFFSPSLKLVTGLNIITVNVKNGSDSIAITREVYYFDKNNPFISLGLNYNSKDYKLYNNVPAVTDGGTITNPTGLLKVEVLMDDTGQTFASKGLVGIKGVDVTTGITNLVEIAIPAPDGITPAHRLVTFNVPYTFEVDSMTSIGIEAQRAGLTISYDSKFNASYNVAFKYLPGKVGITDVKYLKDYVASAALNTASHLPLDGIEVDKEDFYVLVTADQDLTTVGVIPPLTAQYLPVGPLTLQLQPGTVAGQQNNQQVYKIVGFSNGKQKVRFNYAGSTAYFTANISYATKNYIYIENLYDGQSFEINSSSTTTPTISIKGEYRDFENIEKAEFFVNGISGDKMTPPVVLGVTNLNKLINLSLNVDINGPLYYGENRIVFTGNSKDGQGNSRIVRKEIRIYITDTNISNIAVFHPSYIEDAAREPFLGLDLSTANTTPQQLTRILTRSADMIFKDAKYETTKLKYDLVVEGSGAKIINLNKGSQPFFSTLNLSTVPAIDLTQTGQTTTEIFTGTFTNNNVDYAYDLAVFNGKFVLRIKNIPFDTPGSHVYNLELINGTGARSSQRMEVTRILAPFRILSPIPTVGNDIVVNKNFVRFDIEAEGATKVIIGKDEATERTDMDNRFFYDFVGLKPDKSTTIKIQIIRGTEVLNQTVNVYYTSAITVDSQFMAEKVAAKYSVFNKDVELAFPKNTILKSANVAAGEVAKFYPNNKLLFGIADPKDGVLERRNDYGNIININKDERSPNGDSTITIPVDLVEFFNSTAKTYNFTRVSNVYWISGGLGESSPNAPIYTPSTNGLAPYSIEGNYRDIAVMQPERKLTPSQRGTLKLTFNKNVVDEAGTTVTVFKFTERAEWENIGGAVDSKNNTITVPFDEFGYYVVMKQSRGFSDITKHPWARNILNALYSKGIMTNVQADAFGSDNLTSRGEFTTLLVKGLDLPLNYNSSVQTYFDIVPGAKTDTWDFKHIETASRAGIVTGIGEGYFGVDEPITRQQAAVMVARALKLKLAVNDSKLTDNLAKSFMDSGKIDNYARPAVQAIVSAKIMQGQPVMLQGQKKPSYNFNPESSMTRAEAAKIAVELLKKSTKVFPKNLS
ncbi:S-layer homology domain-containing protein [Paenibacillus sp. CMAA1364]